MELSICPDKEDMGRRAAALGAEIIRKAIAARGAAYVVMATGASQFEMLKALIREPGVEWNKVVGFHLDEYIALSRHHPASFRRYLRERFVRHVPIKDFHYIQGEGDPAAECARVGEIISRHPVDLAFTGIGENGHIAFNDPPADFVTEDPYIVVNLDAACRRQQLGEGWFKELKEVPKRAISMSVSRIMKSEHIICVCPDARKAQAVEKCFQGKVTPYAPASILQRHPRAYVYLDPHSAELLPREGRKAFLEKRPPVFKGK